MRAGVRSLAHTFRHCSSAALLLLLHRRLRSNSPACCIPPNPAQLRHPSLATRASPRSEAAASFSSNSNSWQRSVLCRPLATRRRPMSTTSPNYAGVAYRWVSRRQTPGEALTRHSVRRPLCVRHAVSPAQKPIVSAAIPARTLCSAAELVRLLCPLASLQLLQARLGGLLPVLLVRAILATAWALGRITLGDPGQGHVLRIILQCSLQP